MAMLELYTSTATTPRLELRGTHSSTVLAATLMCVMLPVLSVAADAPNVSGSGRYYASGDRASAPALPTDIWSIDIRSTGPQCIVDPNNVRLSRGQADKAASFHISGPANFPSASIDFDAGTAVLRLDPATFPVSDGTRMIVTDLSSGATIGEIDFVILSSPPSERQSLVRTLKSRGCVLQAERLAAAPAPGT